MRRTPYLPRLLALLVDQALGLRQVVELFRQNTWILFQLSGYYHHSDRRMLQLWVGSLLWLTRLLLTLKKLNGLWLNLRPLLFAYLAPYLSRQWRNQTRKRKR